MAVQLQKFDNSDSCPGQNAHQLRLLDQDVNACRDICLANNFGGFVTYRGWAYFRSQVGEVLVANRKLSSGSTLYVVQRQRAPAPVVVQATVAAVVSPAAPVAARSSTGPASAATAEQSTRERVTVPAIPQSFEQLNRMSKEEVEFLQANLRNLEDFVLELPAAQQCRDRVASLQAQNCGLAQQLLSRKKPLDDVEYELSKSRLAIDLVRDKVKTLQRQQSETFSRQQQAPAILAAGLAERAKEADQAAENDLTESLDAAGGPMDSSQIAQFKEKFMQNKMEKHWRLAVRDKLLERST